MPRRIPIAAAKRFVREQGLRQAVIMAWDGKLTHVVTYGVTVEDCAQAAHGGNLMKRTMGWPEALQDQPSRVLKAIAEATRGKDDQIGKLRNAILFAVNNCTERDVLNVLDQALRETA